jgi:hypothetical protein
MTAACCSMQRLRNALKLHSRPIGSRAWTGRPARSCSSRTSQARRSAINAEMIAANLRGIAVQNGSGEVARRFGNAGATPGVAAALGNGLELAWDGELILRARSPLVSNGKRIGFIVMDQSPGSLETELFSVHPTKQRDSQLPWKPSPPTVRSRPVRRRQPAVADSAGDVRSGRRCRRS